MNAKSFRLNSATGALALGVASVCGFAVLVSKAGSDTKNLSAPIPGPAWSLRDVNGKAVNSADFKGKVVILDFWATWCGPCRMEIPSFVELQKAYGDKGLAVVGVSLDEEGGRVVKPFMKQFAINYPIVMGDEKIVRAYGVIEGIPTTFVIDRQGKIVSKHIGYVDKAQFEREVKPLLKP